MTMQRSANRHADDCQALYTVYMCMCTVRRPAAVTFPRTLVPRRAKIVQSWRPTHPATCLPPTNPPPSLEPADSLTLSVGGSCFPPFVFGSPSVRACSMDSLASLTHELGMTSTQPKACKAINAHKGDRFESGPYIIQS